MRKPLKALRKKSPLSVFFTGISLVLFLFFYYQITVKSLVPHYVLGLGFSLPFLTFGVITLFTCKNRITKKSSNVISLISFIPLSFLMVLLLVVTGVIISTTGTDKPADYKKVLQINGYPKNPLLEPFPPDIPLNAQNIVFHYNPPFLQGGKVLKLRFQTDIITLLGYENRFQADALWSGNPTDSGGSSPDTSLGISKAGFETLSGDYNIYTFYSKPYEENNWNHGKISLAAISLEKAEVIFYLETW